MSATRFLAGALACAFVLLCAGCATGPKPLYTWESFPQQQYKSLQHAGDSPQEQISVLQAHAEKASASGAALPPGFRAHLGMLQLAVGNAADARQLWEAEKTAFPESAAYMDQLLKHLDAPAAAPAKSDSAE